MSAAPEFRTRADKRLHQPAPDASAPTRQCRCSAATLSGPAGDIVVLQVAGEADLWSLAVLDAALDDVLDRLPDHLIIDLTALVFCSARALAATTRTAHAATANGTRFSISAAPPMIARLGPHNWPAGDAARIHRTTAAAVLVALALQADDGTPLPHTLPEWPHPVADTHHPGSPPVGIREKPDDTDPPRTESGHQRRPDPHGADAAALRQALHRHRRTTYRTALHTLGASYGAHSLASDLAAQLRIALAGFAATPPDGPDISSSHEP